MLLAAHSTPQTQIDFSRALHGNEGASKGDRNEEREERETTGTQKTKVSTTG